DVGLVDHHHRVCIALQQSGNGLQVEQPAGGRVGIGEDDAAIGLQVVLEHDFEVLVQRNAAIIDLIKTAVNRIEAVGDVREQQRLLVLEQAHEGMGKHLAGAAGDNV